MEKYSRWSDLTTGINPFVPHKQRLHGNVAVKGLQLLGGTALFLVRAPLVVAVGVVLFVTNVVVSILGFVPFVGRLLKRLTEWLLCSLLLLVLGVFVSEEDANARRLGLIAPGGAKAAKTSSSIGTKDVIVCNHTSFVEILYLSRRFSPVFVFVNEEGAAKGLVHVCGILEALYRAFAAPVAHARATPRKLEDVILNASGPVVVFPEGARSNGKSILKFLPVLEHLPHVLQAKNKGGRKLPLRIHLVAFRYEYSQFSPSHSAGSGWSHFFWMCFHGYHSLRVTILNAKDLNLQEPAPKVRAGSTASTTLITAQVERLRGLLAAMLRTKTVDLSVKDFVSFNAYWDHVTGGGRKAAAEFTDRKAPHEHAQWAKK
uniref:Phospholipid/glycerol acyltransferase domain-containing protein n=1 Tax=Globisporangium ultimum (strain ATCC 200006 / CBS 805.95 / DAOM BR144) TaxID=431595 RepID=K3XAM2_GLOUD